MKFVTQDYYEILNVSPEATNDQVKRAYRMVRQSFRPDSMAIHSLYSDAETEAISAKIDEAFRILSQPEAARRYARYHRAGRAGMSVPKDPDEFFDSVHQLDGSSPIEELARHVGRGDGTLDADEGEETMERVGSGADDAGENLRSAPSADAIAQAEVFIDSLEEVSGGMSGLDGHIGGAAAVAQSGTPSGAGSNRDRTVELLTTGPVANPHSGILGDSVAAPAEGSQKTAAAVSTQQEEGRPMITETVRTRTRGPLALEPLPVETLEAIEMNCGGINGMFIQQVRRELDVSMKDISVRTKIGMAMLTALEAEDRTQFQARVYMKGYLRQICRLLHLPVPDVPQRYVDQLGIE